jgi:RHS repeat-associated protein
VTGLLSASGTVVERYLYSPYGSRTVLDGNFDSKGSSTYDWTIGHHGLPYDRESGLIYNRHRMLHPSLGRFLQRDPLGYVDGMSLYEYVTGNAVGRVDPRGLSAADVAYTDVYGELQEKLLRMCPKDEDGKDSVPSVAGCTCTAKGCQAQALELTKAIIDALKENRQFFSGYAGNIANKFNRRVKTCGDWQLAMQKAMHQFFAKHKFAKDLCFVEIAVDAYVSDRNQHHWMEIGSGFDTSYTCDGDYENKITREVFPAWPTGNPLPPGAVVHPLPIKKVFPES